MPVSRLVPSLSIISSNVSTALASALVLGDSNRATPPCVAPRFQSRVGHLTSCKPETTDKTQSKLLISGILTKRYVYPVTKADFWAEHFSSVACCKHPVGCRKISHAATGASLNHHPPLPCCQSCHTSREKASRFFCFLLFCLYSLPHVVSCS